MNAGSNWPCVCCTLNLPTPWRAPSRMYELVRAGAGLVQTILQRATRANLPTKRRHALEQTFKLVGTGSSHPCSFVRQNTQTSSPKQATYISVRLALKVRASHRSRLVVQQLRQMAEPDPCLVAALAQCQVLSQPITRSNLI
jgi:hypothetical protein